MNEEQPSEILVALDASPLGFAALEAAAHLAAELEADLRVLFVEDENLFRLAGLPFAREIEYASASPRPLDLKEMERRLQASAERIRQMLSARVYNERLRWSFHVTRGQVTRIPLEEAEAARLLMMGRESRTLRRLQPQPQARKARPIVAVYDGSPQGGHTLEVAATLARKNQDQIVVVVTEVAGEVDPRRQAVEWLAASGVDASAYLTPVGDEAALLAAVRDVDAKLLLIGQASDLLDEAAIDTLVEDLECPVGIVR